MAVRGMWGLDVGIGTTSPDYNLHIGEGSGMKTINLAGGSANGMGAQLKLMESNDGLYGITLRQEGGENRFDFITHNNSSEGNIAMSILRGSGSVGIGTTNPGAELDVRGATDGTETLIQALEGSGHGGVLLGIDSGDGIVDIRRTGGAVSTHLGGNADDTYFRDGNVGIGTTSPTSKLSIVGSNYYNQLAVGTGTVAPNYQLFIAMTAENNGTAYLQTIKQGTGYNQNLSLQALGGNVGIRTRKANFR